MNLLLHRPSVWRFTPFLPAVLAAVLAPLLAVCARATTVVAPSFDELVNQSDFIVRAVVKSVSSEVRTDGGRRHILTKVELDIREVISGSPPQSLVLQMVGGRVGNEEMVVEGAPRFRAGDEDILFIRGNGRQYNPLVALMHGRYPIRRDGDTGREYVLRSNGAPLYSEQEVARPMEAATAAQPAPGGGQPLSPAEFTQRIHAVVTRNHQPSLEK